MKRIISILLMATLLICTCGCGKEKAPQKVTQSTYMSIDGICVNDGYRDKDDESLRMLYLFFTVKAGDQNLKIDSKYMDLKFEDANSYTCEHYPKASKYMNSYYYSSYIENVYTGGELKVLVTFEIPEAEFASGRKITIADDQLPDEEKILLSTDDIRHFTSQEELAQAMDPTAYAEEQHKREPADATQAATVSNLMNGYYWTFYVNYVSYKLEFSAPNTFSLTTSLGQNGGTYEVKNGYVFCTYPSNGAVVEIPYEIVDGELELDVVAAFDVREN